MQSPLLSFHDFSNELSGTFKQKVFTNVKFFTVSHSFSQLLWWDYCSWEASSNSCPPVYLHLTSLIFHHLKLFLSFWPKYCLSGSDWFWSQVLTPTLSPLSEREKNSHKITLKRQENLKKRNHKDLNAKWEQSSGFTPFLPNIASASLRSAYMRDLQGIIWLTTWRQLF